MKNNILVIGGTGKTGSKVVKGLKLARQQVRIGSRSETPSFDWNDTSSWPNAVSGWSPIPGWIIRSSGHPGSIRTSVKVSCWVWA